VRRRHYTLSIALANNPGGAALGGTTPVAAVGGTANFSGLTLKKTGSGYTLRVTGAGLTGATTTSITVKSGKAAVIVPPGPPTSPAAPALAPRSFDNPDLWDAFRPLDRCHGAR
jgi:hypothetical protein